jgi:hypothetical protein
MLKNRSLSRTIHVFIILDKRFGWRGRLIQLYFDPLLIGFRPISADLAPCRGRVRQHEARVHPAP